MGKVSWALVKRGEAGWSVIKASSVLSGLSLAMSGSGFAIVGSSGCALKRGASADDRRPALNK